MIIKIFLNSIVLALSVSSVACSATNPSHKPNISGKIIVNQNSQGKLCFSPKLQTAKLLLEDYSGLNRVSSTSFDLIKSNSEGATNKNFSSRVFWVAKQNNRSFELADDNTICMNNENKNFDQELVKPLESNNLYIISMRGQTENGKFNVTFNEEFYYPLNK